MPAKTSIIDGPDPVDVHVGSRVRAQRRRMGLTQEGLAEALGLTFQQVQKYERGANRVSASKLYYIARTLRVPISYFFEGLDDPEMAAGGPGLAEAPAPFVNDLLMADLGPELAATLSDISTKSRRAVLNLARHLAQLESKAAQDDDAGG